MARSKRKMVNLGPQQAAAVEELREQLEEMIPDMNWGLTNAIGYAAEWALNLHEAFNYARNGGVVYFDQNGGLNTVQPAVVEKIVREGGRVYVNNMGQPVIEKAEDAE